MLGLLGLIAIGIGIGISLRNYHTFLHDTVTMSVVPFVPRINIYGVSKLVK